MILYFSGTGNSAYVAKQIGQVMQDNVVDLSDMMQQQTASVLHSDSPWIIVTPTYAWRIPRIVHEWLSKATLNGNKDIYFVMTCGGSIGNAEAYLEKLCNHKGMHVKGCHAIVMPDNYIALYDIPSKDEIATMMDRAEVQLTETITMLKQHQSSKHHEVTLKDKISSGIVNDLFYPFYVHATKFYVEDTCISCGKCQSVCLMNNILMEKGKPIWNDHCTHCMACINRCPVEAIQYGKRTKGRARYVCPK